MGTWLPQTKRLKNLLRNKGIVDPYTNSTPHVRTPCVRGGYGRAKSYLYLTIPEMNTLRPFVYSLLADTKRMQNGRYFVVVGSY